MWGFSVGVCFDMRYFMSFSSFANILTRERAGCFAFVIFWMYCYSKCSMALPHGAMGGMQCMIVVFPDHTHLFVWSEFT